MVFVRFVLSFFLFSPNFVCAYLHRAVCGRKISCWRDVLLKHFSITQRVNEVNSNRISNKNIIFIFGWTMIGEWGGHNHRMTQTKGDTMDYYTIHMIYRESPLAESTALNMTKLHLLIVFNLTIDKLKISEWQIGATQRLIRFKFQFRLAEIGREQTASS